MPSAQYWKVLDLWPHLLIQRPDYLLQTVGTLRSSICPVTAVRGPGPGWRRPAPGPPDSCFLAVTPSSPSSVPLSLSPVLTLAPFASSTRLTQPVWGDSFWLGDRAQEGLAGMVPGGCCGPQGPGLTLTDGGGGHPGSPLSPVQSQNHPSSLLQLQGALTDR